jgi:hypothetical protein
MPAKDGGAAALDRAEGDVLDRGEPMRAAIPVAVRADNVRQLQPRGHGTHGSGRRRARGTARQEVEPRGLRGERGVCQMPVPRRRLDRAVAQQPLDGVDVDARFEQVRGKRVT